MANQTDRPSDEVTNFSDNSTTDQADRPRLRNSPDNSATDETEQGEPPSDEETKFNNTIIDQADRPSDGLTNTPDNSMTDKGDPPSDEEKEINNTASDQADRPSDEVRNSLENSRKVLKKVAVTTAFRICLVLMTVFIIAVGIVFAWWWAVHQSIS